MNRSDRIRLRQVQRMRPRRGAQDVGLMDQKRFRKDAGFKMNNAQYEEYLKQEAEVGEKREALQGFGDKVTDAEKKYESAMGKLNAITPESVWADYRKGWKPIHTRHGFNIEGTYYLPQEALDKMHTEMFNQGNGSFVGAWTDDGAYNVDVRPQGTSDAYGKELHEQIGGAEKKIWNSFMYGDEDAQSAGYNAKAISNRFSKLYEGAGSVLPEGFKKLDEYADQQSSKKNYKSQAQMIREKVATAKKSLEGQRDIIQGYRDQYNSAKGSFDMREEAKKRLQKEYKEGLAKRKALFGTGGK